MKKIRVMIADDQEFAYIGMKEMVERAKDLTVVAIATTPSEVIKFVEQYRPDVILLDLLWKHEEIGPELCREIVMGFPDTKVVAFSQYVHLLSAARIRGAVRTLHKDATKEELWQAIRWSASRSPTKAIPPEIQFEPLTPREIEVLQCAQYGRTDRQIGQELGISHNTVKGYVQESMRKLGAANRTEAVAKAIHLGLITS